MRLLGRLGITLAVLVVIYGLFVRLNERSWLFNPAPYPVGPWYNQSIYHAQDIRFPAVDGSSLDAWWVPTVAPERTVLLFHSRRGNLSDLAERILRLRLLHSNVFAVDYRGYGKSQGRPSVAGVVQDGESAYQYLTQVRKIPPQRIVVQGDELGAAVAAAVAARHPQVAALVLESPFPNLRALGNAMMPLAGWFMGGGFPVLQEVRQYPGPKLVLFGGSDANVPAALSQEVYDAASEPKLEHEWPAATQNLLVIDAGPSYSRWMTTFYQKAKLAPAVPQQVYPKPTLRVGGG
ncbi:MAG: alpha/beta hydrolase [Terriglobales bacterium]